MRQFIVVHVGDRVFALPLDRVLAVHEAVPVAPVPLVAPHVEGLAAVRGEVLMVVNLACLSGTASPTARDPAREGGRLILVRDGATTGALALRVDKVAGMTAVEEPDPAPEDAAAAMGLPVAAVSGCVPFRGRDALLLDPAVLAAIGQADHGDLDPVSGPLSPLASGHAGAADPQAPDADPDADTATSRALVVRVGGTDMAIPLESVREIFGLGDLRLPPNAAPEVLGLKPLRRRLVLVLSLARLLGLEEPAAPPVKAVLFGRPGRRFALAVDAVPAILAVRQAEDMPDVVIDGAGTMLRRVGPDTLDGAHLNALLAPYLEVVQAEDVRQEVEETRRFITFDVGATRCALDLGRVHGVMPWRRPDPVPRQDAAASRGVDGVVNGRGEVLPVLDLPRWLGSEEPDAGRRNAFVVADVDGAPWALAVNRLGRVISVPASAVEAVGAQGRLAGFIRRDDMPVWVLSVRPDAAAAGAGAGAVRGGDGAAD